VRADRKPDRKAAAALKYRKKEDAAPRVVASGRGIVAENIIKIAREHGIYLHPDPNLAAILASLDIGQEIPESLYRVVAEILAFVYALDAPRGRDLRLQTLDSRPQT
jgi:flagellar biosynthesis protein